MTPAGTQRILHEQLCSHFECAPGLHGDVRVMTPLMYPDRDALEVFLVERDGDLVVTDHGDAIGWLRSRTVYDRLTPRQLDLINNICRSLGVTYEQGALSARCSDPQKLAESVMLVAQAMVRLVDISFTFDVGVPNADRAGDHVSAGADSVGEPGRLS